MVHIYKTCKYTENGLMSNWKFVLKACLQIVLKAGGSLEVVFFFKWEGKAGAAKENAGLQVIWASCYVESNVFICMRYLTLEHFG